MRMEVFDDAEAAGRAAAEFLARSLREAVEQRGRCFMACSGGTGPWQMFRLLAETPMPWERLHIAQVDERVAPDGHPERNWTHLRESLIDRIALPGQNAHAMPVEQDDLEAAAARYAAEMAAVAGAPAVFDVMHLGIGSDGHTASLVPGDPVLQIFDRDVAITDRYQGRRRMTLTYPALNRARCLLWLITGAEKADALARLLDGDASIPAGRVNPDRAVVFADRAARC